VLGLAYWQGSKQKLLSPCRSGSRHTSTGNNHRLEAQIRGRGHDELTYQRSGGCGAASGATNLWSRRGGSGWMRWGTFQMLAPPPSLPLSPLFPSFSIDELQSGARSSRKYRRAISAEHAAPSCFPALLQLPPVFSLHASIHTFPCACSHLFALAVSYGGRSHRHDVSIGNHPNV
jgi:hypothetical protein